MCLHCLGLAVGLMLWGELSIILDGHAASSSTVLLAQAFLISYSESSALHNQIHQALLSIPQIYRYTLQHKFGVVYMHNIHSLQALCNTSPLGCNIQSLSTPLSLRVRLPSHWFVKWTKSGDPEPADLGKKCHISQLAVANIIISFVQTPDGSTQSPGSSVGLPASVLFACRSSSVTQHLSRTKKMLLSYPTIKYSNAV